MFDATVSKFRDVEFKKVDCTRSEENTDLKDKYGVNSFPRLVFVDGGGTVLYNGGAPAEASGLEQLIGQYH